MTRLLSASQLRNDVLTINRRLSVLFQVWILPFLIITATALLALPLSRYLVFIMDGQYRPLSLFAWFEQRVSTGPQNWKSYLGAMLFFTCLLFTFSFLVLCLQPWLPLNPEGKTLLAPSLIFNAVASFITNTDLQHYAGEQHLSNFSQIFFGIANLFISSAMGLCVLSAIIRALRGESSVGNFFVDMWRVVVYLFLPVAIVFALIFMQQGSPMTLRSAYQAVTVEPAAMGTTDKGEAKPQTIVVGPVAAFEAMKMLGTNGGGFYAMNSGHPFENPTALSNIFINIANLIFPFAIVLMFGRMMGSPRHGNMIFSVMMLLALGTVISSVYYDTLKPNPGLTEQPARQFIFENHDRSDHKQTVTVNRIPALPIDQHLGNLEGKEMRFGTSAGAVMAALTDDATCGAPNAEMDSMNPLAAVTPMIGMWLNCIFGGKGAGMINMLMFIIIGIFIAGMMVGRSPEYFGKKVGGREIKLVIIGLLIHPFMILLPVGLFAAMPWGMNAVGNPGAHGFSEMLYQFSSAGANNGSAFDGLSVTYGFWNNPNPAPEAVYWDIATGLVMILSRFLPLIAMLAMAAFLGAKKPSPFGMGTLRIDNLTFSLLLLGTIIVIGMLLFLPVAVLGPVAEHLGPMPFG